MADAELCLSLYIQKSCLAVFKGMGLSDFEVHHGGSTILITDITQYSLLINTITTTQLLQYYCSYQ